KQPVVVEAPADTVRPASVEVHVDDAYGRLVHARARRCGDRMFDLIDASPVLSDRAKLIDKAVSLAGTESAEWYLTAEFTSRDDDSGPGLAGLLLGRTAAGSPLSEDEFFFVAGVCTLFFLFAVMADRDRLSAARTFVEAIGTPAVLDDVADALEHAYPTRRPSPRPKTTIAAYLARADQWLAEYLGVDNSPGLGARQATTVTQRFSTLYLENVLPALHRVE
ncbi:MAG: hypothetical protein WAL35_03770, partial [Acidimicrobiales bacterium]